MALFAIVIALLLEQIRPLGAQSLAARQLRVWTRQTAANTDAGTALHGWLAWSLAVVLPAVLAAAIHLLALWAGGWLLALAWNVVVLYLTLGFRQFSHHFTTIRDALEAGDDERARQLLARWQGGDTSRLGRGDVLRQVIETSVLAAHRHVFGVLACYGALAMLGLGPAGAVLYRNAEFVRRYWQRHQAAGDAPVSQALLQAARSAWRAIDWLPARMTALGFAIVGSFEDAIDCWRNFAARFADPNEGVILAATAGAIDVQLGGGSMRPQPAASAAPIEAVRAAEGLPGQPPQLAHLTRVVGLVWRVVVLWLFLLALLTLAHVLG